MCWFYCFSVWSQRRGLIQTYLNVVRYDNKVMAEKPIRFRRWCIASPAHSCIRHHSAKSLAVVVRRYPQNSAIRRLKHAAIAPITARTPVRTTPPITSVPMSVAVLPADDHVAIFTSDANGGRERKLETTTYPCYSLFRFGSLVAARRNGCRTLNPSL